MKYQKISVEHDKKIALVAHDNNKGDLLQWAKYNRFLLAHHELYDPDVKARLRMAVVWNIPIACNRASADFMISSPLMDEEYDRLVPGYSEYRNRSIVLKAEYDLDDDAPV